MSSKWLLHQKMQEKGITQRKLSELVGATERTISKYLNGITVSGPYLTKILEILDISVEEWNQCVNVVNDVDGRKCEWENTKKLEK